MQQEGFEQPEREQKDNSLTKIGFRKYSDCYRNKKETKDIEIGRDREFDEVLRRKISETLDKPIDEKIDADDLMFNLGLRYLSMVAAEKKNRISKKENQLSLWVKDTASKSFDQLYRFWKSAYSLKSETASTAVKHHLRCGL